MRLAGLKPCGVLCELTNPDGTMARLPEIAAFAEKNNIPVVTIEDLIDYRKQYHIIELNFSNRLIKYLLKSRLSYLLAM
ncbi:3,4-dihydroxy-2-butanone 4-phosphate synthase [Desulfosporosinus acididurans]|uniref:3,4-dihydroxy-2-butanone-4-phosphate synthase n=1 Tax=Desulfosporosinus acididurans TaxID=476652 RepID=A0A0J1IGD7_9FIRM|nr:3,4-dihydroxy-2-butanone 4-phosphate synthase [Desulfosporosinus acididurans]